MGKHTPGPWHNSVIGSTHGPDGDPIMTAGNGAIGSFAEEGRANARLIAAAPDLLAACEAVALAGHKNSTEERFGEAVTDLLPIINAAIAKATKGGEA